MNKKQTEMIVKVLLDNDKDNPFRYTLQKINKVGKNRLRGAEPEDIQAYSYLLIVEYLSKVSIDEWNSMDDKLREKDLLSYCNDRFKKLSKSEGINIGVKCEFDKEVRKYKYYYLNLVNVDDVELSYDVSISNSRLAEYIFDVYMNENYLTKHQLRYIHTVVNNYVDDGGNVRDIVTDEVLYTKQASYKHRRTIREKLEPLIDNDLEVNNKGRWTTK